MKADSLGQGEAFRVPEGMPIQTPCPMCRRELMEMRNTPLDIPYFGDALQTTVICTGCGFRYSDMQLFREKIPLRYTLRVECSDDLSIRVVRSASGTVRIPELGMNVEPGLASDAFVTNVEGILERFRGALEVALDGLGKSASEEEEVERKMARAQDLLARLDRAREGGGGLTIVMEDPAGNSAILHRKAVKEEMTPEEASRLRTGYFEIDISDFERDGGGD